jgi:transcriptional regulator with XRE-family HTH domain
VDALHRRMAERIRDLAAKRGITVSHLPDRAGVGAGHFWRVMNGSASPSLQWLERIAAALDVEVADLVAPVEAEDVDRDAS